MGWVTSMCPPRSSLMTWMHSSFILTDVYIIIIIMITMITIILKRGGNKGNKGNKKYDL